MTLRRFLVVGLFFGVVFGGCAESPRDAYSSFLAAATSGSVDDAFSRFSQASREILEEQAFLARVDGKFAESARVQLFGSGHVDVRPIEYITEKEREAAFAVLELVDFDGNKQDIAMVKEDGLWRIDIPGARSRREKQNRSAQ